MTQETRKKKTRDLILDVAVELFNDEGEANVTTNAIADEMDISPGTLHYHFKSKEELVSAIFEDFDIKLRQRMDSVAHTVEFFETANIEFEFWWNYRFIFRDLPQLRFKYAGLRRGIGRMVHQQIDRMQHACEKTLGVPNDRGQADSLARSIVVLANYWFGFEEVCGIDEDDDSKRFARLMFQLAMLVEPYLDDETREAVLEGVDDYLG